VKFASVRTNPALVELSTGPNGKPAAVYFDAVVHESPSELNSRLVGNGRFNFECWVLGKLGLDVAALTPNQRFTATFFFDGLFPFVVLIVVSLFTGRTDPHRVAVFYGIMKTPVGET